MENEFISGQVIRKPGTTRLKTRTEKVRNTYTSINNVKSMHNY